MNCGGVSRARAGTGGLTGKQDLQKSPIKSPIQDFPVKHLVNAYGSDLNQCCIVCVCKLCLLLLFVTIEVNQKDVSVWITY